MSADEGEVVRLTEPYWLASDFWPTNVALIGQPLDAAQIERGVALMPQVIRPYICHQEIA